METKKALLLIGSPKMIGGASAHLGKFLLDKLLENGFEVEKTNVNYAIRNNGLDELVQKANTIDVLIISTPLYVDSIPAPLIYFLEKYKDSQAILDKKLIAIVNSGFPEASHNNYAVEILRRFALKNGFTWMGGYRIGGGGVYSSGDISKSSAAKNIMKAFHEAALMIKLDKPIPQSNFDLASKSMVPALIYTFFGQLGWVLESFKYRSTIKLWAKPYINTR